MSWGFTNLFFCSLPSATIAFCQCNMQDLPLLTHNLVICKNGLNLKSCIHNGSLLKCVYTAVYVIIAVFKGCVFFSSQLSRPQSKHTTTWLLSLRWSRGWFKMKPHKSGGICRCSNIYLSVMFNILVRLAVLCYCRTWRHILLFYCSKQTRLNPNKTETWRCLQIALTRMLNSFSCDMITRLWCLFILACIQIETKI